MKLNKMTVGLVAAALLVLGGCSGQKNAATEAVTATEAALATIQADAAKFLPGELESVESSLTSQKQSLASGDYKTVVANAPALTSSIDSLKAGVAAKVEEAKVAAAEWGTFSTAVPQMVTALQSRVDTLAKSKRMPKGLDASTFATVQTDLESMKADWAAATAANDGGNPIDAVTRAKSAQATGQKLLQQLGMSAG